jgi:hypothetical protein
MASRGCNGLSAADTSQADRQYIRPMGGDRLALSYGLTSASHHAAAKLFRPAFAANAHRTAIGYLPARSVATLT